MRMETSLSQRQELRLRLAPQILQSIEILQLATLDLKGLIEREMEMNPTIEIETEMRNPARIAGRAPGRMILRTIEAQERPKDWPMRIRLRSTLSTPP